jgi:hypothetical protein
MYQMKKEKTTMRDLKVIASKCIKDLNDIGIYPNITPNEFKATTQYKTWGLCKSTINKRTGEITHKITISKFLLDENVPTESLIEIIYHEALHACDECYKDGHDGKWLEYATIVNKCYGCDIKECSSNKELGVNNKNKKTFQAKCVDCGYVFSRQGYRAPKWVPHPSKFYHTHADGTKHKIIPIGYDKPERVTLKIKW